jgi:hypothetical protein
MNGKANLVRWAGFVAGAVLLFLGLPAQARYAGGSGTVEDPYLIGTAEQVNAIGLSPEDWDKHFRLVADVDMNDLAGSAVHLVGTFQGVFDGNGHTIASLVYVVTGDESPSESDSVTDIGLFRSIQGSNAVVKDLGLVDADLRPASTCRKRVEQVGALAGRLLSGSVRNCFVEGGQVLGETFVGGLVGSNAGAIFECHTTCVVGPAEERSPPPVAEQADRREYFGGLVGLNYGDISHCRAAGDVIGEQYVGGLVGESQGTISDSQSSSTVSGDDDIGGLVGRCRGPAQVLRSYATGRVSGQMRVGGLAGACRRLAGIIDCHATGGVSAEREAGGLVGSLEGTVSGCYANGSVHVRSDKAGGLVGRNSGTIRSSWAGGYVSGKSGLGGLVGYNWDAFLGLHPLVTNSYARGNVQGGDSIGGLIGHNQEGTISRCYATGRVTGESPDGRTGGLVGQISRPESKIEYSFWDTETSGLTDSAGGTGKTTAEMQNIWTYIPAGWDFEGEPFNGTDNIWKMCCGRPIYPRLAWEQMLVGDFVNPEGVDFADLGLLAGHWLETMPVPCGAPDLNFDARIDMKDFVLMAQHWGQGGGKTIFETTFDAPSGWTMEGQWQFGRPGGGGAVEHGNPDPASGYTGDSVYGVNLQGDYRLDVDGPHYLTAGPFDCRAYHDVQLRFARWLNTDEADYVSATVEVSFDRDTWAVVWKYDGAEAVLADAAWQVVVYSLGRVADHQEHVYIRWGYEIMDREAWPMSGWNIDDFALTGVEE